MLFDKIDLARIQFATNPIKVVAAQIRFAHLELYGQEEVLGAINSALKGRFPIAGPPQQQVALQFSFGPQGIGQSVPFVTPGPSVFTSSEGGWILSIGTEAISLETTTYTEWPEFRARWVEVIAAVESVARPGEILRLGLRYIDELEHKEARTIGDWSRFLRSETIGTPASELVTEAVTRSNQQITLERGDDAVTLRHAYSQNPDKSPVPSTFIIDMDVFTAKPFSFDEDEVLAKLDRYHQWAWNLFRSSLTDEMVAFLGVAK